MMMVAKNIVSLLVVLMITTPRVPLVRATTTTTTTDCSDAYDACFADENCLECITRSVSTSTQEECEESYQDGTSTTQCGYEAISYCCQSEISATAQCVQDDITIAYWTCILEEGGCSIDDMPCIVLETPAPITTASPTTIEYEDYDIDDDASENNWAMGAAKPSGMMYAFGLGAMAAIVGMVM